MEGLCFCASDLQEGVRVGEATQLNPPQTVCGITKYPHHLQDGGVAADDERQTAETFDAMSDSHWKLLVEVFGTALR